MVGVIACLGKGSIGLWTSNSLMLLVNVDCFRAIRSMVRPGIGSAGT